MLFIILSAKLNITFIHCNHRSKITYNQRIMKNYSLSVILLFISLVAMGQESAEDVLYLKNGSIIRGKIIEKTEDQSVRIELPDRNIISFRSDEILKTTKEKPLGRTFSSLHLTLGLDPGFEGYFEYGNGFNVLGGGFDYYRANLILGGRINKYFYLGIGTGIRNYFLAAESIVPAFADLRLNFTGRTISPYIAIDLGYSFNPTKKFDPIGLFINPQFGLSLQFTDQNAVIIGFGIEFQRIGYDGRAYFGGKRFDEKTWILRTINFGCCF
jgi:hypothetical protein